MKFSSAATLGLGLFLTAASASPVPTATVASIIPAVTNHPHRETIWPPHQKPPPDDDTQPWGRTMLTCDKLPRGELVVGDLKPQNAKGLKSGASPAQLRSHFWAIVRNYDRKLDELEKTLDCLPPARYQKDHNDAPEPEWVDAMRFRMGMIAQQVPIVEQIKTVLNERKWYTDRMPLEKNAINPGLHEWTYADVLPTPHDQEGDWGHESSDK